MERRIVGSKSLIQKGNVLANERHHAGGNALTKTGYEFANRTLAAKDLQRVMKNPIWLDVH